MVKREPVTCSADATDEASDEVWPEGSSRLRSKLKQNKKKTYSLLLFLLS